MYSLHFTIQYDNEKNLFYFSFFILQDFSHSFINLLVSSRMFLHGSYQILTWYQSVIIFLDRFRLCFFSSKIQIRTFILIHDKLIHRIQHTLVVLMDIAYLIKKGPENWLILSKRDLVLDVSQLCLEYESASYFSKMRI
ncbi:unnamed protein product [Lupinus luteus]|uniref:Uncharacterized protein n=1 Tax=Lupinus luteus TaxID=3873 RepID=A0AAV1WZF7_LUPLU